MRKKSCSALSSGKPGKYKYKYRHKYKFRYEYRHKYKYRYEYRCKYLSKIEEEKLLCTELWQARQGLFRAMLVHPVFVCPASFFGVILTVTNTNIIQIQIHANPPRPCVPCVIFWCHSHCYKYKYNTNTNTCSSTQSLYVLCQLVSFSLLFLLLTTTTL